MTNPIELIVDDELILRQFSLADAEAIFNLIDRNREHLSKYDDDTANKYPTIREVVESILTPPNPEKLRFGIWTPDAYVGTINLTPLAQKEVEVGYYLGREFQGKGYMTRAVRRIVPYAINEKGFDQGVMARVHVDNAASSSVLMRCGFKKLSKVDDEKHVWYGVS